MTLNFDPVTLTFDLLTLNLCGRSGITCSIHLPNLSEIDQCAAELLTINDRFFVHFRGCSNTAGAILKTRGRICTKLGGDIVGSSLHTKLKNGDGILLGVQTTAAQSGALLSDKAKIALFDPL